MATTDLLILLDYMGTLAFALSGVALAVEKRLDIVGAAALAFCAGLAGGISRDLLIGESPPLVFQNTTYLFICLGASTVALLPSLLKRFDKPREFFDAAGLGLFCVVGAAKASEIGLSIEAAALIGAISACGGGVARDILTQRIPQIFTPTSGLYLIPAACGAAVVALAYEWDFDPNIAAVLAASAVFLLRLASLRFGWRTRSLGKD